jgi:HD-GYP domain-containing protein (c-di-GMP phosphodiesterase class II)
MELPRRSLHRTILIRLLPAWLCLSLVMGSSVYWIESKRVIGYACDLASEEADRFDLSQHRSLFEGGAEGHLDAVRALLHESRFTALRLYGRNHEHLLEARKTPDPGVDQALGGFPQVFPKPPSYLHSTLRVNGRFYVRVLLPLMDSGQEMHGYLEAIYLVPPRTVKNLEARVGATLVTVLIVTTLTSLVLYPIIVALNRGTVQLSQQLLESVVELMRVLGSAVAKRDGDTDSHNYRVTLYAVQFAEALGRPPKEIAGLIAGAFLHDVGKIGISDAILLKQDKLTSDEFRIMQRHVPIGEEIISDSRWLGRAREVVAAHHEWFDGSGYPKGLKGLDIPSNARLFAIVDVFDALNSKRPYKAPMALEQTLGIMRDGSGRHFDPEMLALFFGMAPDLYRRFNGADIQVLKLELATSVSKYFPT